MTLSNRLTYIREDNCFNWHYKQRCFSKTMNKSTFDSGLATDLIKMWYYASLSVFVSAENHVQKLKMKRNLWLESFQSLSHLIGELQLDGTLIIAIDMLKVLKCEICNWPLLIRKFPILSNTLKKNMHRFSMLLEYFIRKYARTPRNITKNVNKTMAWNWPWFWSKGIITVSGYDM